MRMPELPDRIRVATPADVPAILRFITELADFERAAELARATEAQLESALFGEQAAVHALMATDDAGASVGFALWFRNFSTWEGVHGIHLEDLYVTPDQRGSGLGRALLHALARIAVANEYARLDWWVLDWNPARRFYESLGARALSEWVPYRVDGAALRSLARPARGELRAGEH